mmetsp:Transcript_19368/g.39831  ORF Transcript_19368/g.39831 Transcript_19368/m.39831 type:complete len:92 (-) Transcript_19368:760-1035(-)
MNDWRTQIYRENRYNDTGTSTWRQAFWVPRCKIFDVEEEAIAAKGDYEKRSRKTVRCVIPQDLQAVKFDLYEIETITGGTQKHHHNLQYNL